MKILVTGASGNVGSEVVQCLLDMGHEVFAGVRSGHYSLDERARPIVLDFEMRVFPSEQFDAIFVMRPPKLTNPDLFEDFLQPLDRSTRVVFLSVQGADEKSYLPHAKIEKRIAKMGFAHVFVRPCYFMENLLTTLWPELETNHRIYLPAGRLEFDWVSVRDVAAVCTAALIGRLEACAIEVCSGERFGFAKACETINKISNTQITYIPATLFGFIATSRNQGVSWGFIGIMLLLHFLPRLRKSKKQIDCDATRAALGREPQSFSGFVSRNKSQFETLA